MTDSTNDQIAEAIESALTAESIKTRRWVTDELAKVKSLLVSSDFIKWRVDDNSKRLDEIEKWSREVDREYVTRKEVQELGNKFDNLQKVLITTSLSVTVSAVIWAVGVLLATGKVF